MQIVIDIPEDIYKTIQEEEVGNTIYKAIKNGAPIKSVEMGRWVTHPAVINSHIFCNLCLTAAPMDKPTKYCPGCGSLMKEVNNEDNN